MESPEQNHRSVLADRTPLQIELTDWLAHLRAGLPVVSVWRTLLSLFPPHNQRGHLPMPEIQIDWHSREEYERLRDLRDRHGLLWRGVLLEGAKNAESLDLIQALFELNPELSTRRIPGQCDGIAAERASLRTELREQAKQERRIETEDEPSTSQGEKPGSPTSTPESRSGATCEATEGSTRDTETSHFSQRERLYRQWDEATPADVEGTSPSPTDPHTREFDRLADGSEGPDDGDSVDPYCDYDQYELDPNEADLA